MNQIPLSDLTSPMYLGLVDDAVIRADTLRKFPGTIDNGAAFEQFLRRAAVLDRPILLNDGYLLHHAWGREQLCKSDSLLRQLMVDKRVVLMTREPKKSGNLWEMIRKSAEDQKIPSYRKLWGELTHPKNEKDQLIAKKLERIHDSESYVYSVWPAYDNRRGFTKLMLARANMSTEQLGLTKAQLELWKRGIDLLEHSRKDESPPARTKWELICEHLRKYGAADADVGTLLHIGNEAYHYNMAMCVASETGKPAAAVTRLSPCFAVDHILQAKDPTIIPTGSINLKEVATIDHSVLIKVLREPSIAQLRSSYLEAREVSETLPGNHTALIEFLACEKRYLKELMRKINKEAHERSRIVAAAEASLSVGPVALGIPGLPILAGIGALYEKAVKRPVHAFATWVGSPKRTGRAQIRVPLTSEAAITIRVSMDESRKHTSDIPSISR